VNYLEIIKNVVNNGVPKQATRYDNIGNVIPVENGTIGTFCEIFRHDMSTGFPLTTLRQMPWRSIRVELEGFIKGITDKRWYKANKCNFWNEWANPLSVNKNIIREQNKACAADVEREKTMKQIVQETTTPANLKKIQAETDDLGPIYGYQWRYFGQQFGSMKTTEMNQKYPNQWIHHPNGVNKGFDQLKSIINKLKTSPYDRRMVCSAWNPNQMDQMALPPCHWGWNVVVYGNKLNLIWHQRSCDLLLGVGANIASYALLLELLAKEAGLVPGELVGTLADCHIYENHMDAARELITREEVALPTLEIFGAKQLDKDAFAVAGKRAEFDIFKWSWEDAVLHNYNPQEKINVGAVTV
jgi:thymidylate synthase